MSAGAPWSVKGIDPKARAAAKDLARRSGQTLGEWLNSRILEEGTFETAEELDAGELAATLDRLARRLEASEREQHALTARMDLGVDHQAKLAERVEALAQQVAETRAEVLQQLESAPAAKVEARLAAMAQRVRASERRSAEAVERMGNEVLRLGEAMGRRLTATEERSAEAIDLVGTEIARIAGAVEARLARAETAQAHALERLGAEVGRIADGLAEQLTTSERRAADAIEGVGEQVSRLAERMGQPYEAAPAPADLPGRNPESESRLAAMLASAAPKLLQDEPAAETAQDSPSDAFVAELFQRSEPEPQTAPGPEDMLAAVGAAPLEAFHDSGAFAPLTETEDDIFAAEVIDDADEEEPPEAAGSLSTREVIEQARAAAREKAGSAAVDVRARVNGRQATGRLFAGFGGPAKPRRPHSALNTALMVAGGAAFLSVGAAGVVLMDGPEAKPQAAVQASLDPAPRTAVAYAPELTAPSDGSQREAYEDAVQAAQSGKPGGLAKLQAIADAGYAPAQFYLGQLYQAGEAGLPKDMAKARLWTALAAEAGAPGAMHNLAIYYFHGDGGPQDLASAAQWFRKAAELGLVESQYNLGLMYQSGSGVKKDLAEARKWFEAAAAQGDPEAGQALAALKAPEVAQR